MNMNNYKDKPPFLDISQKNLDRMFEVLEIVVNELELQTLNRLKGNRIPWRIFKPHPPTRVISILQKLNNQVFPSIILNDNPEWIKLQVEISGNLDDVKRDLEENLILSMDSNRLKGLIDKQNLIKDKLSSGHVNELLELIPERNRKYKFIRKIACAFVEESRVDNWKLASCLNPTFQGRKFRKSDYTSKNDPKIKNRIKTLNDLWKSLGKKVTLYKGTYSELVTI